MSDFFQDQDFQPMAEGVQTVELDNVELARSKAEAPMLKFTFKNNEGKLWTYMVFQENTKGVYSGTLKKLGVYDEVKKAAVNAQGFDDIARAAYKVLGDKLTATFSVMVKHEMYNGNLNAKLDSIIEPVGAASTPSFDENEEVPF